MMLQQNAQKINKNWMFHITWLLGVLKMDRAQLNNKFCGCLCFFQHFVTCSAFSNFI